MREPRRLLLVKLSSIGDVVQALPVAAALRRRFPGAYLAWAVGPAAAEVLVGNPHLDEVLVIGGATDRPRSTHPGGEADSGGVRLLSPIGAPGWLRRELRAIGFDLALDLQGLFKSAVVAYLSGARERVGYRSLREGACLLYTRRLVRPRREVHAVESYLDFAEALGAARRPVDFALAIAEPDRAAVDGMLGGRRDFAALIPGARWESKLWPAARFAAVADALSTEFGLTPVVVGGPGDGRLAAEIAAAVVPPIIDLTGRTTLKQAAEVFRRCRVTVGNDTGPLYLSSAVGTPTVAVFGPTDARRLGPYGEGHARVVAEVDCAPCRNRRCRNRRCMEAVESERVVAAVRRLLEIGRREASGVEV